MNLLEPRKAAGKRDQRTADGAILVPVTINKTTAYMYIEIASHMSVISQQAVDRLKLPVRKIGEAMEVSMGSHRVEAYASAREFALAGLASRILDRSEFI